ncbi:MAG: type II secretion system minor pseudopilin GspI [Psychromonas sp.]|nr:type II secretion system minor pseudopilin GspI [Psychromonas sp.]
MNSSSFKKQVGMTLIEVMLALAILGISGLAVMNSASAVLINQGRLQEKTIAFWIASNGLVELKLEKEFPTASWKHETKKMVGKLWYLRYKTVSTANPDFKALDIEVSHKKDGNAIAYLRTYIMKPVK